MSTWPSVVSTITDPTAGDRLNAPSHSSIEASQNDAIEKLETFIGTNASAVGTLMYNVRAAASDGGGHVQTANRGGTGQTAYTLGDILVATSSSVVARLAVGPNGQVLQGDSNAAAGISWGSVAGLPASITSFIPRGGLNMILDQRPFTNQSVAAVWQVPIPFPIRVSVITVMTGDAVTTSGTLDFTLYRESGASSLFTVTTPTLSAIYTTYSAYLSPTIGIDAGNYYAMANTNAATNFNATGWNVSASVYGRLGNISGEPVINGTYVIAGGSPPASIVTTAITSVVTAQTDNLFFRIDG